MPSKDDQSFLYTGVNSSSYRRTAAERKEKQQDRKETSVKLQPAAELIKDVIEEEKRLVCDVKTFVVDTRMSADDLKVEMLARKMNLDFIESFHAKIKNKLRVPNEKVSES